MTDPQTGQTWLMWFPGYESHKPVLIIDEGHSDGSRPFLVRMNPHKDPDEWGSLWADRGLLVCEIAVPQIPDVTR